MAIQNEIIKVVAQVELDDKSKEEFTKGLKDANDCCDALRKTIVEQQKSLLQLAAAGKEEEKICRDLQQTGVTSPEIGSLEVPDGSPTETVDKNYGRNN